MKKEKKSVVKTEKKDTKLLMFAGAQSLLNKPENEIEAKIRRTLIGAAAALRVSPFGINLLGNVPYINKLGLNQKMIEYNNGAKVIYEWIHISENDDDKSVCKAKIIDKNGKDLCDWIIGECSPKTTKMSTLVGYQNHIAQTRAHNRAIQEAFGTKIHEDMLINLAKLKAENSITDTEIITIGQSILTSSDEVIDTNGKKEKIKTETKVENDIPATESDINLILKLSAEVKPDKKFNVPENLTKAQANKIITDLMKLKQKNGGNN